MSDGSMKDDFGHQVEALKVFTRSQMTSEKYCVAMAKLSALRLNINCAGLSDRYRKDLDLIQSWLDAWFSGSCDGISQRINHHLSQCRVICPRCRSEMSLEGTMHPYWYCGMCGMVLSAEGDTFERLTHDLEDGSAEALVSEKKIIERLAEYERIGFDPATLRSAVLSYQKYINEDSESELAVALIQIFGNKIY